jgi:murein DD-endopeptidase MepM/ murein hydrolase activator NlpD
LQIIIVHPKLKQARTLTLRPHWIAAAGLGLLLLMAAGSGLLSYVTLKHAFEFRLPLRAALGGRGGARNLENREQFVRQNLDALAVKLGQLQAQLARIDAIGERVMSIAGLRPADLGRAAPGQGGAEPSQSHALSFGELSSAIDAMTLGLDNRGDQLGMVESDLMLRSVMSRLLPSAQPLEAGAVGSRFGWRIDPFSGRSALHEGMDFNAPSGTPIVAAGAGMVVFAGWHHGYGNQVDIDHGGGLITRYAHASKLLVREGDIVRQGQRISEVGSTGRSTGAHLHFEVRVNDEAKDPLNYLRTGIGIRGFEPLLRVRPPRRRPRPPRRSTRAAD